MGIKNVLTKVGGGISNIISKAAVLNPEQLADIKKRKEQYILEMPDPNSSDSIDLTQKLLGACGVEIHNAYLSQLNTLYSPLDVNTELEKEFDAEHNIRYFNITKWVVDKEESSLEKLVNVYEVLSNENCNIALIFDRKVDETKVYLAVVNLDNSDRNTTADEYRDRLLHSIRGNFPGTECKVVNGNGIVPCLDNERKYSVASVSNIPTEKSEKFISQTIEKLIDGIVPSGATDEYILVLLATPVTDIEVRKLRLSEYYSGLAPYSTWQTRFDTSESTSNNSMFTLGANIGASTGVNAGTNQSKALTQGTSHAITDGTSKSVTEGVTDTLSKTNTQGVSKQNKVSSIGHGVSGLGGVAMGVGGFLSLTPIGIPLLIAGGIATGLGSVASSIGDATLGTQSTSTSEGQSTAKSKSTADTISHSETDTTSQSNTNTVGNSKGNFAAFNFGINFARSSSVTATVGKSEGISQTYVNYSIKHTLEVLEEQMKRLEQSTALGLWDFSAYVLSENPTIANNVAHTYLSLTQGEKSYLSNAAINLWRGNLAKSDDSAKEICYYLKQLRHPVFALNPIVTNEYPTFNIYPTTVTAATSLSGKELAYSLNFPKKSITGMPVIECASFGRNVEIFDSVKNYDDKVNLGHIFHMHHQENVEVNLSSKSLTAHTFITGSTGSGKSNTVYQILNEAIKNNVKFMVVEPTKGEYKDVFCVGNNPIAKVYGTNAEKTPLLRINPFSFPKDIHIYEHMDRLVEIFNVCWPMYAAMPAILKNAIEKAYEDCGWNLIDSKNPYGDNFYPNFNDVARNVKQIIESSEYDAENKGAYKGSLLTRLQSLTNGINGLIFTNNEIPLEELFDENVIIDISRVGSNETKSLIMGMMVLKLQEYRIANRDTLNADLKHLTVLEEAHNLLKRTSTEVLQDSGNLLGKSVEMVSNAIAEMRTYGEGFIIVDQAPGLLDMAAIRNTNTKIIMRLPDEMDRKLVGKAANLNDDQIIELAKLPMGVGAIYQNDWIEPVLCKVNKYESENGKYNFINYSTFSLPNDSKNCIKIANVLIKNLKVDKNVINDLNGLLEKMNLSSYCKVLIKKNLFNAPVKPLATKIAPIMSELFPKTYEVVKRAYKNGNEIEWTRITNETLNQEIQNETIDIHTRRKIIQSIMTQYLYNDLNQVTKLEKWSKEGGLFDEVR